MKEDFFNDLHEKPRRSLEEQYNGSGLTISLLQKRLRGLSSVLEQNGEFEDHRISFYADTSDPIQKLLEVMDVKDKIVTSVAGGGDFLQLFADLDAKEVHLFDFSPFALLWNELKATALQNLNFEAYKKMFNAWREKPVRYDESGMNIKYPAFSKEVYMDLRSSLTMQARYFFDSIVDGPLKPLSFVSSEYNSDDFIRTRGRSYVPDVIDSEEKYNVLQKKMSKLEWSMSLDNIEDMVKKGHKFSEEVYLSNIGYNPNTSLELARDAIASGAKEVVCNWDGEDFSDNRFKIGSGFEELVDDDERDDSSILIGGRRYKYSPIALFAQQDDKWPKGKIYLRLLGYGKGIEGTDIHNYGHIVMISSEDNPGFVNH